MKVLYWIFIGWWAWPLVLLWKLINTPIKSKDNFSTSSIPSTPVDTNVSVTTPPETTKEYVPKQSKIYSMLIPQAGKDAFKLIAVATRFESWEKGKAIWNDFYKDAFEKMTDVKALEGSGIYKITNTTTGMVYIGQAVNIKKRWKEHIRIGCGADWPTGNQMYRDMYECGPENFTYQVIDYCANNKKVLDSREGYWITFYNSKENGYNKTRGNHQ